MSRENQNKWTAYPNALVDEKQMKENKKVLGINWQNPTPSTATEVFLDLGSSFYFPGCLQSTSEQGRQESKWKSLCCQPRPFYWCHLKMIKPGKSSHTRVPKEKQ